MFGPRLWQNLTNLLCLSVGIAIAVYFIFAATQGPYGLRAQGQFEAHNAELSRTLAASHAERDAVANLVQRLSDESLDLDLLDEQARKVLGYVRLDEAVLGRESAPQDIR